ncbi:MAG: hypothetical protein Q9M45_02535 [Robiginitomaculum sp.]|nr:hypothetical protein [Robiginitomaculum sp.]
MSALKRLAKAEQIPPLDLVRTGLDGLSLVEAQHEEEEALVLALAIRRTLETPQKTAVLITPDRALAERVSAALWRWNIRIDDSAGAPLDITPHRGVSEFDWRSGGHPDRPDGAGLAIGLASGHAGAVGRGGAQGCPAIGDKLSSRCQTL